MIRQGVPGKCNFKQWEITKSAIPEWLKLIKETDVIKRKQENGTTLTPMSLGRYKMLQPLSHTLGQFLKILNTNFPHDSRNSIMRYLLSMYPQIYIAVLFIVVKNLEITQTCMNRHKDKLPPSILPTPSHVREQNTNLHCDMDKA